MLHRYYLYPGDEPVMVEAAPPPSTSTPYADLVASLGAVAYWPLQNTSGTEEINGYDLTWAGGTPTTTTGPGGELAVGIVLVAASNQWGYTGNVSALRPTTGLTVVGWVKITTHTTLAALWNCGTSGYLGYRCYLNANPGITSQVKNGTDTISQVFGYRNPGTGWVMVAQTYDKTNQRQFVYGATFSGGEVTGSPQAATYDIGYGGSEPFYVGYMDNTSRDLDGAVAGYAVFGSALTAQNISDLYDAVTT